MKVQDYTLEPGLSNDRLSLLKGEAIALLKQLIAIPSFSREEDRTCLLIERFLSEKGVPTTRKMNNVWASNKYFDPAKPSILLSSHHDTVKPNAGYINDPFSPTESAGKIFGLGSNDAGGALVSLLAVFLHYYNSESLKYNLIFAATAEEEISGLNGIESILAASPTPPKEGLSNAQPEEIGVGKSPLWGVGGLEVSFAIVGEPTLMQMAIAEKGLMVLDCKATGRSGHAAREEGDNAIYKALKDIEWFRTFHFPKVSETLGPVKMSVTVIKAGTEHNVVPAECDFTLDIRTTDAYTNEEVLEIIKKNVSCEVKPRSLRLRPSSVPLNHPFVVAGKKIGRSTYGSPTTSDKSLMPFLAIKMGPGDSARSHIADEFIYVAEIEEAIELYCKILEEVLKV